MAFNQENIMQMHLIKYDLFKSQDPETGQFDVMFEVGGKIFYAHKSMLNLISDTFAAMLSDRWTTKDQPIKIKDYGYDDFYQFLTFLYSGQCELNESNIFTMVDIAEFYGVDLFKKYCDDYLSAMKITVVNAFRMIGMADKYSMVKLKASTHDFIANNFHLFVNSDEFLKASKSVVEDFVAIVKDKIKPTKLFQAAYKWAEARSMDKQAADQNINRNDIVRAEISTFLQHINFNKMTMKFLVESVVSRGFIFSSYNELSKILSDRLSQPWEPSTVTITNSHGQTLHGKLIHDKSVDDNIISLENKLSAGTHYWDAKYKVPKTQSPLRKKEGVEWYLFYYNSGELGVYPPSFICESYYVIAEMIAGASGFGIVGESKCTIEID